MKKSGPRKTLKLSRETLQHLNPDLLKKLNGGVCMTSYAQTTCPTCTSTICP
jgi:hypothetical protein